MTLDQKLDMSAYDLHVMEGYVYEIESSRVVAATYLEKGNASSRANAHAILAFASIALQPVKNCTSMTKNHIIVPPVLPPALKKIWATGMPVGVVMIAS